MTIFQFRSDKATFGLWGRGWWYNILGCRTKVEDERRNPLMLYTCSS